ncbi:segregation/condensation protein A [Mycoplasma zalophidermidis]|uniref:Segregation and condensation protein A n=1 Tax=Mycoplasma zalophidermidis TaxID=398174 RepID=A0ABS6DR68_9MOLU|nr:segregation/condensation protein A [Mycoplasma zalophidermidis]MBU4689519.1 segregation/condensation protein A [Mycoplasma zalophidermidis]MBU4693397.1 segregation/condensation protein A [Mycoplasma zalophidermidis]MCR8966305.1 segregation/condensation protein A [Mycoplasma zalophidermidis]
MNNLYESDDKKFDISIENFDGPLDLLLALVQDKHKDIMDVDVAELASAYLKIIQDLQENEIDLAGEYLVMAATLLALKTKMMLFTPEEKPEIEEDKREILRRLYEYQQFKEISKTLREHEELRTNIFIKKPSDIEEYLLDDDKTQLDGNSTPLKLITILRKMFERTYAQKLRKTKLDHFQLTPQDQIPFILELFKTTDNVTFEMIFNQPSMNHFVITFMAVLVLVKMQKITMEQNEQFGTITFAKGPDYEK